MSNPAAFSGDYTDLRFIKTRSVAAITIEIPIEQASAFVAAFGAPVPSSGCPVAIARILPSLVKPKERRPWSALSCAEQAGIRCNEPAFWQFLNHSCGDQSSSINSAESAATFVRGYCNVISRSDIKLGTKPSIAWMRLDAQYDSWLRRQTF